MTESLRRPTPIVAQPNPSATPQAPQPRIGRARAIQEAPQEKPGEPIPFSTKFTRQRAGQSGAVFKKGETIAATVTVHLMRDESGAVRRDQIRMLVHGIDVRRADEFIVKTNSREWQQQASSLGIPFQAEIKITGPGEYVVSNMFRYSAEVRNMRANLPLNPNEAGAAAMEYGRDALVEGVIESIDALDDRTSIIRVRTPNGTVPVVTLTGLPRLEADAGSGLASAAGSFIEVGDRVRLSGYITDPRARSVGPDFTHYPEQPTDEGRPPPLPKKMVGVHWCRSSYLLQAGTNRLQREQERQQHVANNLRAFESALDSESFDTARERFADLRGEVLSHEESQTLRSLFGRFPTAERPLTAWDRKEPDIPTFSERLQQRSVDLPRLETLPQQELEKLLERYVAGFLKDTRGRSLFGIVDYAEDAGVSQARLNHYRRQIVAQGRADSSTGVDDFDWGLAVRGLARYGTAEDVALILGQALAIASEGQATTVQRFRTGDMTDAITTLWGRAGETGVAIRAQLRASRAKLEAIRTELRTKRRPDREGGETVIITGTATGGYVINTTKPQVSSSLRDINWVLESAFPELGPLSESSTSVADFDRLVRERVAQLETRAPKLAARASRLLQDKGYTLVPYRGQATPAPAWVHHTMNGQALAMVNKKSRSIYFHMNAIRLWAADRDLDVSHFFDNVLANEMTHVISDNEPNFMPDDRVADAAKKIRARPPTLTEDEHILWTTIEEEVLSSLVGEAIERRATDPDFAWNLAAIVEAAKPSLKAYVPRLYGTVFRQGDTADRALRSLYEERAALGIEELELHNRLLNALRKLGL